VWPGSAVPLTANPVVVGGGPELITEMEKA
jgi:hypothetical protein